MPFGIHSVLWRQNFSHGVMKDVNKFYTRLIILCIAIFLTWIKLDGYLDITAYAQDTEIVAMAAMLQYSYNATC